MLEAAAQHIAVQRCEAPECSKLAPGRTSVAQSTSRSKGSPVALAACHKVIVTVS